MRSVWLKVLRALRAAIQLRKLGCIVYLTYAAFAVPVATVQNEHGESCSNSNNIHEVTKSPVGDHIVSGSACLIGLCLQCQNAGLTH